MRKIPTFEVFLTLTLTLFCLGLGFNFSPASADCCSKEKAVKVVSQSSCCKPKACCCAPTEAPIKETQSLAGFYNLRREFSTSTVGLAAAVASCDISAQSLSLKDFLVVKPEPTRSKLFILYRSLLI